MLIIDYDALDFVIEVSAFILTIFVLRVYRL